VNTTQILQDRIRAAFAPAAQRPVDAASSRTLVASSAEAFLELDLTQRIPLIRSTVRGRIVFTTSFGIEDQAIAHAIFRQAVAIEVVTLDTGRLFPQTYELWAQTERRYRRRIPALYPDRAGIEALVARQGVNGFYGSIGARHACCGMRKIDPLRRAIAGATAWITGLRADQSEERAGITFAAVDPDHRVIKVNPLFDWTREQVLAFVQENGIPYNRLHDQGFLSIGRAPCTRAVAPGEPERAGRWWWERDNKKECGLHARPLAHSQPPEPAQS
jgi:phosphoadenosine phosphosulfate reductase